MRPQPAPSWNFDAGLTTFEFLDGETLTLNYDVTVTDGVETDLTTVAINSIKRRPDHRGHRADLDQLMNPPRNIDQLRHVQISPIQAPSPLRNLQESAGLDQQLQITDTGFTAEDLDTNVVDPAPSAPTASIRSSMTSSTSALTPSSMRPQTPQSSTGTLTPA